MCLVLLSCGQEEPAVERPSNVIVIKGSESEKSLVRFLADEYSKTNKGITFEVVGGGSEVGINDFKAGICDIANSSRIFEDEDYAQMKSDSVKQAIIAIDAIAIIANPYVRVGSLSLEQLSGIYSGKIKNWKELGGKDTAIMIIHKSGVTGTSEYMLHRMSIEKFGVPMKEYKSYQDVANEVVKHKNAIGYVRLKYATNEKGLPLNGLWVMPINTEGFEPCLPFDVGAIADGGYPLTRPLFQYYIGGKNPEVEKFINYELSPEAQMLMITKGLYPINDFHKQINKMKM